MCLRYTLKFSHNRLSDVKRQWELEEILAICKLLEKKTETNCVVLTNVKKIFTIFDFERNNIKSLNSK